MTGRAVLLVGATGAFGTRLAVLLVAHGFTVLALARDAGRLAALAARLGPRCIAMPAERDGLDAAALLALRASHPGLFALVDASGPFQGAGYALPRAAIAAGLHAIDLADARDYVAGIGALDAEAKAADVAVLAGASSSPALTQAVVDLLNPEGLPVVTAEAAISPGNRAPRGQAVMTAILSYAGRPVRVFRGGRWGEAPGWGLPETLRWPGLGRRRLALVETPDLDLLVARCRPRDAALFKAGLELALLHQGLAVLSLLVRAGLLRSLAPLTSTLHWIAERFAALGSDRGGMRVRLLLEAPDGALLRREWRLLAEAGDGPSVPVLPALAALRLLARGELGFRGAAACAGLLPYAAIAEGFAHLAITTAREEQALPSPLFQRLLGARAGLLPTPVRAAHAVPGFLALEGIGEAEGAATLPGRLLAWLFRLPRAGHALPLRVEMRMTENGGEAWHRIWPGVTMRSVLGAADPADSTLDEVFGPFRARLRCDVDAHGLTLTVAGGRFLGLPIPRALLPRSVATEAVDAEGRFTFDVPIALPLIGRLAHYRGWLKPLP
ncbi:SDR family oxidoreductase [Plastoroseomonas hellenica]|uniref:SDR family oxidoreductase n=1 Tax=Plastoroseomonas hellenica TaxID=2687306 RepID=UPI001BA91928|nr:SDR family oxidoreductase [Plastoroseomonas hellenica]MBR0644305.1 DUF4166 domain-containing protein [Plastoroseomonas hellenica]